MSYRAPPGPEVSSEIKELIPDGHLNCHRLWMPPNYDEKPYRPKGEWNKKKIIAQAKAQGASAKAVRTMDAMLARDLWSSCMTSVGWMRRGRVSAWQWVEFWGLDMDAVAELGAAA